jgi:hypothetical protein
MRQDACDTILPSFPAPHRPLRDRARRERKPILKPLNAKSRPRIESSPAPSSSKFFDETFYFSCRGALTASIKPKLGLPILVLTHFLARTGVRFAGKCLGTHRSRSLLEKIAPVARPSLPILYSGRRTDQIGIAAPLVNSAPVSPKASIYLWARCISASHRLALYLLVRIKGICVAVRCDRLIMLRFQEQKT